MLLLLRECGVCGSPFASGNVWARRRSPLSSRLWGWWVETFPWASSLPSVPSGRDGDGGGERPSASCRFCQTDARSGVSGDFIFDLFYWILLHMCKYCIGSMGRTRLMYIWLCQMGSVFKSLTRLTCKLLWWIQFDFRPQVSFRFTPIMETCAIFTGQYCRCASDNCMFFIGLLVTVCKQSWCTAWVNNHLSCLSGARLLGTPGARVKHQFLSSADPGSPYNVPAYRCAVSHNLSWDLWWE